MDIIKKYLLRFLFKKTVMIMAGVIFLYGIFGFFIAPGMLKSRLIGFCNTQLGRNAAVRSVRVNPFSLSVTLLGFEMNELSGQRFIAFERLYINFQLSSIFRRAYTFNEIYLGAFDGHLIILKDGRWNFSDLLSKANQPGAPEKQTDNAIPAVLIHLLTIDQGRFQFMDESRPTPYQTMVNPIKISLKDFSTRTNSDSPYAFTATTEDGGALHWQGNLSVNPMRSEGRIELSGLQIREIWKYIQDQVHFEITEGVLKVAAQYRFNMAGGKPDFELTDAGLELQQLKVTEKGQVLPLIAVAAFTVAGGNIRPANNRIDIASINIEGANVKAWLNPDGSFNYLKLLAQDPANNPPETRAKPDTDTKTANRSWIMNVAKFAVGNSEVSFEDRTPSKPVLMQLGSISFLAERLSNASGSRADLSLAMQINQQGSLNVKGSAGMDPLSIDLAVQTDQIPLASFQPYLSKFAQIDLVSGVFNADGRLKVEDAGKNPPRLAYQGKFAIENFRSVNKAHSEDFVKWAALTFDGVDLRLFPDQLKISKITFNKPYIRLMVWPDKTMNINEAFPTAAKSSEPAGASPPAQTETKPADSAKKEGMPITINAIQIKNGSMLYTDYSLKPNFTTGLYGLNGTIKGLSSKSWTRADVLLEGNIDQYAPIKIEGQINPLGQNLYTDLSVVFKNIELASYTPYSGKYAGYTVSKGKLSFNLKYHLSENELVGENKIFIDQFHFGDRVESPDATKMPVRLAVALLKDRFGRIDIDLPVRGNINDPDFKYGRIVFKLILNLLVKIVSSPFTLIGKLVGGGGEELSYVEFTFGSSELVATQTGKLDKLAKALIERPALQLEITGMADNIHDRAALAEAKLLLELKQLKVKELQAQGAAAPALPSEMVLSEEEYNRLLVKAYTTKYGAIPMPQAEPSGTSAAPAPVAKPQGASPVAAVPVALSAEVLASLKSKLLGDIKIEEDLLRNLGQTRSQQIKSYLIEKGNIADEKLFISGPKTDATSNNNTSHVELTLSGS